MVKIEDLKIDDIIELIAPRVCKASYYTDTYGIKTFPIGTQFIVQGLEGDRIVGVHWIDGETPRSNDGGLRGCLWFHSNDLANLILTSTKYGTSRILKSPSRKDIT